MTKNQNKTRFNSHDVEEFIASIEHDVRRTDAEKLLAMMETLSGYPPKMYGTSMIGFGTYHYKYDSGREGDSMKIGFSPRKANLVLYIMPGFDDYKDKLARLGKCKTGKSCLYINKLADVNLDILAEIITISIDVMNDRYG
ncbi:MAG: DUF1801 domain-containing protein [Rhizobiales bacterium]|nr:DUF1801 domain-containing protein [Hyphomicrobiales bacterium]NRB14074.1 DUF1801 domain-containing protein [Hyphomicrobiales bacterium]